MKPEEDIAVEFPNAKLEYLSGKEEIEDLTKHINMAKIELVEWKAFLKTCLERRASLRKEANQLKK